MTEPVLYWNNIALEANRRDHSGQMKAVHHGGPTRSARALAIVHIAMHDACVRYYSNPSYQPWLETVDIPGSATKAHEEVVMAISGAAYMTLKKMYPSHKDFFDANLLAVSTGIDESTANKEALAFGKSIGERVFEKRKSDMNNPIPMLSDEIYNGNHKDDPFNSPQPLLGKDSGRTDHFALKKRTVLDVPPGYKQVHEPNLAYTLDASASTYSDYISHFRQVKEKGRRDTNERNIDETLVGLYWAYDGVNEIGTPPRLYNQIAVEILSKKVTENEAAKRTIHLARWLMLINVAMADAATEAWFHKFNYNVWRPVVGIREHGDELSSLARSRLNVDPDADPFWEPLGAPNSNSIGKDFTPPFPAYPSGHATFGAAAFEMIRLIHGFMPGEMDNVGFDYVSDELNGQSKDSSGIVRPRHNRRFDSMIEAMYWNGISRVYLGVHWRFDATTAEKPSELLNLENQTGGIPLGRNIAADVFTNLGKI